MNNLSNEYLPDPNKEPNGNSEPNEKMDAVPLRSGEYNPLATGAVEEVNQESHSNSNRDKRRNGRKPMIEFYKPSQLKAYKPRPDQSLVGDCHIQRGAPTVIAGPPGCGKSRATLWLAILGARGEGEWFGRKINCRFKTLIVQSENGPNRLSKDFNQIAEAEALDDFIRITAFPSYCGFEFANPEFREELKMKMRDFAPDLVIFDPWNEIARDSMEKDYQEAFELVREVMAEAPNAACLIVHHLRKPRADDKHRGRNLAHLLAGSYVLQSKPRCVIVMQPASDDTEDARVVVTPVKNNDGEFGPRTAWERKAVWFEPLADFDWETFDGDSSKREPKVNEGHIRETFENGRRRMKLKNAVERLEEIADVKRSAAYEALKLNGRFAYLLEKDTDDLIGIKNGA